MQPISLRLTLAALGLAVAAPLAAQEAPAAPAAEAPAAEAPARPGRNRAGSRRRRRRPPTPAAAAPRGRLRPPPGAAPATPQQPQVMEIVKDTFGDWQVRCAPDGNECFMYQLALDAQKNPVAEVSILKLPEASEAEAGVTVVTPLGTLLTNGLVLQIDGGETRQYPFVWCSQVGCFSRFGLAKTSIDAMKRGNAGKITPGLGRRAADARGPERVADRLHRRLRRARPAAEPAGCRRRPRRPRRAGRTRAEGAAADLLPRTERSRDGPGRAERPALGRSAYRSAGGPGRRSCPPKAKAFDIAASTRRSRASFGTTSRSQSGSGSP